MSKSSWIRTHHSLLTLACVSAGLLVGGPARAIEGQWRPSELAQLKERASAMGLDLSAKQLWDEAGDERTGGLLRAVLNLNGCSAAFISADGLIATNHHCAYGALQANSSVEHDYITDGFLASDRAAELRAPGTSVKLLRKVSDVTDQVEAKLAGITDDTARAHAFDKTLNEIVDACEAAGPNLNCRVAGFFNNSLFELHEYVELEDVRLVYAPPSAIGEYGGETDNWMWPRHTGDFSLLRAYVDDQPYHPAQWLRPTADGVDPGDFVAVLGYPGRTERYLWAAELARHHKQLLPMRVGAYGEWIDILEAASERDPAVGIKVAAFKKSLANRHKNAAGKIAGLDRLGFVATREAEDKRLIADPAAKPIIEGLTQITEARRVRAAKVFLLENLGYAPRSLAIARDLVTWAQQRGKPDVERKSGYRDRDRDHVKDRLEKWTKDHDARVDIELLASFLGYADMLTPDQRIAGFDAILGKAKGAGGIPLKRDGVYGPPPAYVEAATAALQGSTLADPAEIEKLLDDPKLVTRSKDPMIVLARALVGELDELALIKDAERGRLLELEPEYFELIRKIHGQHLYSDANGTLRVSLATVQGYSKWNDDVQAPQTVLAEAVAKNQGAGEFNLPDKVLEKAKTASTSRWRDRDLGDVPIAFLADGDTTGGNSGSPVIDGQGRLIGFNFDRVWETVSGDYVWRPSQSRNIIADVRFLYWMLDEVAGATSLLEELGVADYQGPPAKVEESEPKPDENPNLYKRTPAPAGGCACGVDERGPTGWTVLGVFALLGLVKTARRSAGRSRRRS